MVFLLKNGTDQWKPSNHTLMFDIKEGGINLEKPIHGHVDHSRRNLLAVRDIRALKRILIEGCQFIFILLWFQ